MSNLSSLLINRLARTISCTAAVAASVLSTASATAQSAWPERPVQMVVPFPAGGGVDVVARAFADRFAELIGRPVVIVNRDGASGTIGVAQVAAARPDGYTLGFITHGPLVIQPHLMKDLPYKPDALAPICNAFAGQYVLAAAPGATFNTLGEMLAGIKASPGKLSYGFGGIGTTPHLAMSEFVRAAGLDMLSVPYRGDPAAIVGLRGGEISVAVLNLGLARAQGLRVLATFAEARQPDFPNAPTIKESGWNVTGSVYGGLVAPKGIADDLVRRIDADCDKVVADPRYRTAMKAAAQEPEYKGAAAFAQRLRTDLDTKRETLRRIAIPAN